ncbi:hypothetical protein HDU83_006859 [Entophlyctis luteolus]|nr:hypothetical protein HDU83_006859 [Entophlyctis luteolus]
MSAPFVQRAPATPPNTFAADRTLRAIIARRCGEHSARVAADLTRFADVLASPEHAEYVRDAETNLPQLRQYSAWGERIDRIDTAHGWKALKDLAAVEGLVAIAYTDRALAGSTARVHQFAKLFLFSPVAAMVTCPLAMTDGAARVIELHGGARLKAEVLPRLLSRDPDSFATSGQWMTEKPGGSDVACTETIAVPLPLAHGSESFVVTGRKWFSSATDADYTLLLAREGLQAPGAEEFRFADGSRGLSLFFAKVWVESDGQNCNTSKVHRHARRSIQRLNGIRVVALKNKHGTKQLPTAELELDGMKAIRIGSRLKGVKTVSTMLNITRLHAAVGCVAGLRHCLFLAKDFARKRRAFGRVLIEQPLQAKVLADLEVSTAAMMHGMFYVVELLGDVESSIAPSHENEILLRFLTPVMKAWTSKTSIAGISECMESLGGVGYVEEAGVSSILKDISVNSIWEGATNVMSLDVLRVLVETKGNAAVVFVSKMTDVLKNARISTNGILNSLVSSVESELNKFAALCVEAKEHEEMARSLLFEIGYLLASVLLIEEASKSMHEVDIAQAERWVHSGKPTFTFGLHNARAMRPVSFNIDSKLANL